METFSLLLAICAVAVEFPAQRPVTRSFDVFFDLRLNKQLGGDLRCQCTHYDFTVMYNGSGQPLLFRN